jgi:Asp/Glu/hydantoin racemase
MDAGACVTNGEPSDPRRILVINPNSSVPVTQAIDAALAQLRLPGGPLIETTRLAEGPPGIATQRDSDSVVVPLQRLIASETADAFVIACFSDPGLYGAREAASGRPVMGIAEWGILRALSLGERFGIIALAVPSIRRQQRYVRLMAVQDRYAGSRAVQATAEESAGAGAFQALRDAGRRLVEQDGADVIVLGCAGMASHRRPLAEALGVPVVEPSQAAVTAALGAVLLAGA